MAHPHEDLARRAYEAFAQGDMQTLDELIADDVRWHVGGASSLSGTYEGKEATFGFFGELAERSGGSFSVEIHDIIANDEHTVAMIRARATRDGRELDDNQVHVMHPSDGRVVEFWSFVWDDATNAAFWDE